MPVSLYSLPTPDPEDDDAYLRSFAGKLDGADLFRRLVIECLPVRTYGEIRRSVAGHRRFVALVYRIAPEVFQGMTERELAARLGIKERAFRDQLAEADKILAHRRADAMRR